MYINRALLLVLGMSFLFYPTLEEWLFHGNFPWYGIYELWLLVIVATWWNQRARGSDEL